MSALTVRQEKFVEHYAICSNAAEAARLSGYSPKTARQIATENLTKPAIKDAIAARQRFFADELRITKDDVLAGLLSAIQMAREQQNPGAMISGLVQIAKLCGFYEPEVHQVHLTDDAGRLLSKFEAMSDDELLAIVEGRVAP
ncbi:MAG: terminase small subunit [Betaproteobacteria bacterium]